MKPGDMGKGPLPAAVASTNEWLNAKDALLDRYEKALERIADHSQEFTQEVHGYKGYGQALGAVHNIARAALNPEGEGE